jgi:hypothetical protein
MVAAMSPLSDISERLFNRKKSPDLEASPPSMGSDTGSPDLAALRQAVGKGRNKRSKVEVAQEDAAKQAALDELFQNENWEEIAALYFEVRYALTGFEYFRLDERQRRILGRSMGTCMKLLLAIDPQWVALIVFSVNMGTYVTDKELAYRNFQQKQTRERIQNGGR